MTANNPVEQVIAVFLSQKDLAQKAIRQLPDEQLHVALHAETNSIAVIMKHLAGNMLSRWSDFLRSDGEKPWRDRDNEFIDDFPDNASLWQHWEQGWECLFATLRELSDDDLARTVKIRGEAHTVIQAILRQISHYGYHVGQIVQIARILADENWQVLSISRGQSQQYNQQFWKYPSQEESGNQ